MGERFNLVGLWGEPKNLGESGIASKDRREVFKGSPWIRIGFLICEKTSFI